VGRESALDEAELAEVVSLIADGRSARHTVVLPERQQTRHWPSVTRVSLALDDRLGWETFGWKIGAASEEIRRSEGVPSPSAGRLYSRGRSFSPAHLPAELFVNYRNCECEFAFELGLDFPARERVWTEADARAGIESLMPVLEIGDTVFEDWYGASAYFGSCMDNGGAAAFVQGPKCHDWAQLDLAQAGMSVYINDNYVKSGVGKAAMGHPVTSLTWLLNWLREEGLGVPAGEVVSTGTCTGHLFVLPGDTVRADFPELGTVEATFL
jgi:2-keto-4-pentenoate hydratase